MRIIAIQTLKSYWSEYPECEQSLKSWIREIRHAKWMSPNELKSSFGHASVITGKRIVFNIAGNNNRLIVDIEFNLQLVFVVWFGTHHEYDQIDAKTVKYVRSNKK